MYATKPEGVNLKEWAEKTNFKKLPEKVKKKKKDKMDCSKIDQTLKMASIFEYLSTIS